MQMSGLFRPALVAIFLLAGLAQSAHADIATVTGDTTGGPTYNRPIESLASLSLTGTAVQYDLIEFSATVSGGYNFYATSSDFDTFLILYYAFDPTLPLAAALTANDDLFNTSTSGFESSLIAGEEYILVMTSFGNDDVGKYSVTISGPGEISVISAVPEPASWLMLGVGVACLALRRRTGVQPQPAAPMSV
jgi:hypothetical protein